MKGGLHLDTQSLALPSVRPAWAPGGVPAACTNINMWRSVKLRLWEHRLPQHLHHPCKLLFTCVIFHQKMAHANEPRTYGSLHLASRNAPVRNTFLHGLPRAMTGSAGHGPSQALASQSFFLYLPLTQSLALSQPQHLPESLLLPMPHSQHTRELVNAHYISFGNVAMYTQFTVIFTDLNAGYTTVRGMGTCPH